MPQGVLVPFPEARAAAQRLRVFTVPELAEALGVKDRGAAARKVEELIAGGMVRSNGMRRGRRGRPAQLYAFVKPDFKDTTRRRKEPPPEKVLTGGRFVRSGDLVSGRKTRTGTAIVDELLREVTPQGVRVRRRSHRLDYIVNGQVVATSSLTPGASSLKKTRSNLRKAGIAA